MKGLFTDDDGERAVSPVIGVILMVAITVILAAVIASFVLGLGDADDPAPQPTVDTDFSSDELEISFTGGDDFDADVATVNFEVAIEENDGDDTTRIEVEDSPGIGDSPTYQEQDDEVEVVEEDATPIDGTDEVLDMTGVDSDVVSAGDSLVFTLGDGLGEDAFQIVEWDIDVVWDPADQDSEIIVSQSGSN